MYREEPLPWLMLFAGAWLGDTYTGLTQAGFWGKGSLTNLFLSYCGVIFFLFSAEP
jgi:hypothetical protein